MVDAEKAGESVPLETVRLFKLLSDDRDAAALVTRTVYVFVTPFSAVTTIEKVLSPTFNVFVPVPLTVAFASLAAAEIVIEETVFATLTE